MGLFGSLARAYLLDRLLGRAHRRYGRRPSPGHYGHPAAYGYGRGAPYRRRERSGIRFFGPIPYYSARTRRGTQVSVGGCCLPLPLMVVGSFGAATAAAFQRQRRGRR